MEVDDQLKQNGLKEGFKGSGGIRSTGGDGGEERRTGTVCQSPFTRVVEVGAMCCCRRTLIFLCF